MHLMIPGMEKEICGCMCRNGHPLPNSDKYWNALDLAFFICCDLCNKWYHGSCIGLLQRPTDLKAWLCPACSMQQQIEEKKEEKAGGRRKRAARKAAMRKASHNKK